MKRYVILVSFFYIGNLRSMNEDRVVNVQGFMNDDRGNRDREADVQHLENNDVCEWNTLGDIEKFCNEKDIKPHEIDADYIKKYVSIKPYVFVEDYIRRHTFSDEVAKNTLQNKVLLLMDEMKEYDSEKYIGCVLTLLQNYHVSSNQAFKKERNRKKALSHKDQEHVASQPDSMTIDETITEALAAKNDTLQKKIISKECCDKFYQATIVILTLITVIVPIVQPLWGGHSSAMPAPCFNMSL